MNSDTHRRLEVVLDREIEVAHSLATTLDAERAALTGTAPEAVVEKAAQKTELFGVIEQLETQRGELCAAAGISLPNRAARISVMPGVSDTLADRWQTLLELIAGCRLANEVNGYIINARRGQVAQLLQALRGGSTPVTYGPRGKTSGNSLRALARA